MKPHKLMHVAVVAALAAGSLPALAADVLSPGSSWEYTFANPTADASWNTSTGGWSVGPAPFGNNTGGYGGTAYEFDYKTFWGADGRDGDDLWVRKAVDFTGFDIATAKWNLGADNGFKLYVNGALVASDNAEGYTYAWEYGGSLAGKLHSGVNFVAVALEDHGGLTAFDMRITAAPVPEPETYAMMLAGLGLLGAIARRRKAA